MSFSEKKYQDMLSSVTECPVRKEDPMTEMLKSMGISKEKSYNLILHNDNVNKANDVALAIYRICKITAEKAMSVTEEAHLNGRSIILSGSYKDLEVLKEALDAKNLTISIEDNND